MNYDGHFLLIRSRGYRESEWTFAGNSGEDGETVQQAMRREIAEKLCVPLEEALKQLPVGNRFNYSAEHKARCRLNHDGQDAAMFIVRLPRDAQLSFQAEEIAEARWFSIDEALHAFAVVKQCQIFESCLAALTA